MSQPFEFVQGNERLDWGILVSIDLQRLVRDVNVDTLQRIVENLAFARITRDEAAMFTADHTVHLFTLAQVVLQYLVYSQECLAKMNLKLNERLSEVQVSLKQTEKEKDALSEEVLVLKKEVKAQRRTLMAYEFNSNAVAAGGAAAAHDHMCPQCGETYTKLESLQSHMRKRHNTAAPSANPYYAAPNPGAMGMNTSPAPPAASPSPEVTILKERLERLEKQSERDREYYERQSRDQLMMLLLSQNGNNAARASPAPPAPVVASPSPLPMASSDFNSLGQRVQTNTSTNNNIFDPPHLSTIPIVPDVEAMNNYNESRQREINNNHLTRQITDLEREIRELRNNNNNNNNNTSPAPQSSTLPDWMSSPAMKETNNSATNPSQLYGSTAPPPPPSGSAIPVPNASNNNNNNNNNTYPYNTTNASGTTTGSIIPLPSTNYYNNNNNNNNNQLFNETPLPSSGGAIPLPNTNSNTNNNNAYPYSSNDINQNIQNFTSHFLSTQRPSTGLTLDSTDDSTFNGLNQTVPGASSTTTTQQGYNTVQNNNPNSYGNLLSSYTTTTNASANNNNNNNLLNNTNYLGTTNNNNNNLLNNTFNNTGTYNTSNNLPNNNNFLNNTNNNNFLNNTNNNNLLNNNNNNYLNNNNNNNNNLGPIPIPSVQNPTTVSPYGNTFTTTNTANNYQSSVPDWLKAQNSFKSDDESSGSTLTPARSGMQSTYNGTTNNFMNNTLIGGGAIPVPDARSPLGNNYNTTTNYSSMEKTHSPSPNPYDNTNTPLPLPGALNNFNNNTNTNNLYTPPVSAHERSTSPVIGLPNTTNNFSVPPTGYNSLDRYSSNTTYNNNNTISVPNFAKDSPLGGDMTINNNNRDSYYNTDRNTYGSTIPVPLPSQNSPLKRENTFSRRDSLENRTGLDTTYSIGGNTNTYNTVSSLLPSNSLTTTTVPVPGVSSYNNNTSSYSTGLAPTTTGSYFANRLDTNNNSNAVSGVSPYANTSYMTGGTEVRKPRTWSSSSSD